MALAAVLPTWPILALLLSCQQVYPWPLVEGLLCIACLGWAHQDKGQDKDKGEEQDRGNQGCAGWGGHC